MNNYQHGVVKKINSDEVEYWSHPWEIDAYGREIGLLTKYVTSEHLWEVFSEFQNPTAPLVPKPIKWKNKLKYFCKTACQGIKFTI